MKINYPIRFERNYHPALWGGESWEISVHSVGPSIVANGEMAGKGLNELIPEFPLLIKVIEAKSRLSVQVHPNEETRKLTGGDPKTEMWCMLADGFIYAGLKTGVTAAEVAEAVKSGEFEKLMVRHDAKKGDCFFIPGGLVHAIGDNARIYEVQQNSNTTFRLYDWNRVGADGKPRQLHVKEGSLAIDYSLEAPQAVEAVKCAFFDFKKLMLKTGETVAAPSVTVVFDVEREQSTLVPEGVEYKVEHDGEYFITRY